MILVVNRGTAQAENLKRLIEFMDSPAVITATPSDWRNAVGDNDLDALFVGADLSESDINELLDGVERMNPNIQIVMMQGETK